MRATLQDIQTFNAARDLEGKPKFPHGFADIFTATLSDDGSRASIVVTENANTSLPGLLALANDPAKTLFEFVKHLMAQRSPHLHYSHNKGKTTR